jgi:hypothetical protein
MNIKKVFASFIADISIDSRGALQVVTWGVIVTKKTVLGAKTGLP